VRFLARLALTRLRSRDDVEIHDHRGIVAANEVNAAG